MDNAPDFIPDSAMPDFISDSQAGQFFGNGDTSNSVKDYGFKNMLSPVHSVAQAINHIPGGSFLNDIAGTVFEAPRAIGAAFGNNKGYGYKDKETGQFHNIENPFFDTQEATEIRDPEKFAARGVKDFAGAATYAVPGLAPFKGAGILPALGNSAITGAARGTTYGISQQGDTFDKFNPASIGAYAAGGAVTQPVLDVLAPALKFLGSGMLSKGGTWKKMADAADRGANINWEDTTALAKKAAENQSPGVQKALAKLMAEETPVAKTDILKGSMPAGPGADEINPIDFEGATSGGGQLFKRIGGVKPGEQGPPGYLKDVSSAGEDFGYRGPLREPTPYSGTTTTDISSPSMSARQALETRKSLGKRLPQNFFEKMGQKVTPDEEQAINILRSTISKQLKTAAPDIKKPDAIYHIYSQIHGDIPTWARRFIIGHIASQLLPKELRGLPSDLTVALLEAGAGL